MARSGIPPAADAGGPSGDDSPLLDGERAAGPAFERGLAGPGRGWGWLLAAVMLVLLGCLIAAAVAWNRAPVGV